MPMFLDKFNDLRRFFRFGSPFLAPLPPVSNVIGGVTIGTSGSLGSMFEGFTLHIGDDFEILPTFYEPNLKSGRYSANGSGYNNDRRNGQAPARQLYIDPAYRGQRSQSPTNLNFTAVDVSNSILSITPQPPQTGLQNFLPLTFPPAIAAGVEGKPSLVSAALDTAPSFQFSANGDFIMVARIKMPSGVARGWWPSFWETAHRWPEYGAEIDILQGTKKTDGSLLTETNLSGNTVDGGTNATVQIYENRSITPDVFRTYACKKQGNTLTFYDDETTPGTLAQTGTYTNARIGRFKGGHRLRLEVAISTTWDGTTNTRTFSAADYPKSMDVDWWQFWSPRTTPYRKPIVLPDINIVPGGSWATAIPSQTALYGDVVDFEEAYALFDNFDAPGRIRAQNRLPAGMTVDFTTRSISGTLTSATEGGRVAVLLVGSFNDGGQAPHAFQYYNVAPVVQSLMENQRITAGSSPIFPIPYQAFHSGNLGHNYTVTSNKSWAVATVASDGKSATVACTSAPLGEVATITITAANSANQSTTVTRTITAQAAAVFLYDNFDCTIDGADLIYRTAEIGSTWAAQSTFTLGNGVRRLIRGELFSLSTTGCMRNAAVPSSPDYFVEAGLVYRDPSAGGDSIGICGRMSTTANTLYAVRYLNATNLFELIKTVAGTSTVLGSYSYTPTLDQVFVPRLIMSGTGATQQVSMQLNGVEVIPPVIDNEPALVAPGRAGIRLFANTSFQTADTGVHVTFIRGELLA